MSFPRITLLWAFHAAAFCKALRAPMSKDKEKFVFTDFAQGTCTQMCEKHNLVCDLSNLPWKKDKDMKKAVDKLGYDCKGADDSKHIAAPMIEVDDASDRKGKCHYPKEFKNIDCDADTPAGTRRLCYCTSAAKAEEEAADYSPMWPDELRYPMGRAKAAENRKEACVCYAKKGKHGSTAMPPKLIMSEDGQPDYDGYQGVCAEYCDEEPGGPYHAADVHMLAGWTTERPGIILMHGSDGSKDEKWTVEMSQKFADAGFLVMSIGYDSNTCDEDVGNAVEYMKTSGMSIGVDPNSVALHGWSFGGRCVYNAGYNHMQQENQGVKAVIDMSGCGGKGPLNSIDKKLHTPPPALLLGHAENDKTIAIDDCYALVAHSKTKSWDDDGEKGKVIIKEQYFPTGGHNLLSSKSTSHIIEDQIFNHLFMYLGRPCRVDKKEGVLGFDPVDDSWPLCKVEKGESTEKCGGVYSDLKKIGPSCAYP